MKLYTAQRAPNPRRVLLFLAAKQLEPQTIGLEVISVDLGSRENRQTAYQAVNPLGQVPALLLEDGTAITDSMAICHYLEGLYPAPALLGQTPLEQALIQQWSRQAEIEVLYPMMLAFQHGHPFWAGAVEQVAEFAPVSRRRALARFAYFEQRLQQSPYLVGDHLTAADLTLYAALDFGRLAGLRVDEQHPALLAFYQRMHEQFGKIH